MSLDDTGMETRPQKYIQRVPPLANGHSDLPQTALDDPPIGLTLQLNISEATFYLTGMAIKHSLEFDVPPAGSGFTRTDPGSAAVMIGVGM